MTVLVEEVSGHIIKATYPWQRQFPDVDVELEKEWRTRRTEKIWWNVQCEVLAEEQEKVEKLRAGSVIRVRGMIASGLSPFRNLHLDHCIIVNPSPRDHIPDHGRPAQRETDRQGESIRVASIPRTIGPGVVLLSWSIHASVAENAQDSVLSLWGASRGRRALCLLQSFRGARHRAADRCPRVVSNRR